MLLSSCQAQIELLLFSARLFVCSTFSYSQDWDLPLQDAVAVSLTSHKSAKSGGIITASFNKEFKSKQ